MVKIGVIINSTSRLSSEAKKALDLIQQSDDINAEFQYTRYRNHATELAFNWATSKQVVIAVGGDGTCNEVLNGWHKANPQTCAMGIIPSGTGNDFLRMFEQFNAERFVCCLEALNVRSIDYGIVTSTSGEKAFLNISDLGFGAKVIQLLDNQRKLGLKGATSYYIAIIRAFFVYRKQALTMEIDGANRSEKILLVAFCNGSYFGHGLAIHPGSSIINGKLGLTIVGDVSLFTYLSKLKYLKKGQSIKHPKINYLTAQEITFSDYNQSLKLEMDGELFEENILKINVAKQKLPLIC